MALQTHILRRGATYAWRKRLPAVLGGGVVQISLRTNDPLIARRLAVIVSAESVRVFDAMAEAGLSREDAQKFLRAVILKELRAIELRRAAASDQADPSAWQDERSMDWAMGKALMFMSQRGASARDLSEGDIASMSAESKTSKDIERVQDCLDIEAQAYAHPPMQFGNARTVKAMREALDRQEFTTMEFMQGRQIWYQGRAAALLTSLKEDQPFDAAMDLAGRLARGESTPLPVSQPMMAADVSPDYDPNLGSLIGRLMEQKRRHGLSGQMITQMTRVFELFAEATGLRDIRDLRQAHISKFVDILSALPATYRKSPKDRDKPLRQILAESANTSTGLSTTTISRNLDYLGQLLTKARSEGFANVLQIDLGSLRPRKTKRDRDERPAFSSEDIQRLFTHPVWQGNQRKQKWQEPGPYITLDGLYWLPILAALTGARREEIAGLKAVDIAEVAGMPAMQIAPNSNRSVKTLASSRTLPLHPQLIELGLVDHAREQIDRKGPEADLFPDLRPAKAGVKFGEKIDYRFRLLVQNRLDGNPDGKVFHSFRHYVTTQLSRMPRVPKQVRKDILGHVGEDVTSERYTERAPLEAMLKAIRQLPRLPVSRREGG
ncbi:DUF6538 domain-containing protein [Thioclava sp.]|uniref:DUF6538 domain-containing protein n=1 Tax=Thioclava sp. TaxID=1933450 RepID=UPI003AA8DBD6